MSALKYLILLFFEICWLYFRPVFGNEYLNEKKCQIIEVNYGISKLMTDYTSLYHNPSNFVELRFAKQTLGQRTWQSDFGYPEVGLSFIYGDFGNKRDLGHSFAMVPDVSLNTLSDKLFSFKIRFGLGLGYFTNPYEIDENTENTYIGSTLANMSLAAFTFQYKLSGKMFLQYGINYYHCSNGHYQVPNVGMNLPGFKLGLKYFPLGKLYPTKKKTEHEKIKNWDYGFRTGLGVHEFAGTVKPVGGPKYRINTFDIFTIRRYSNVVNINLGLAYKYYTDYHEVANKNEFFEDNNIWKATVISLYAGNEFLMHKVGVFIQTGTDIHAPFEREYLEYKGKKIDFGRYMEEFVSSKVGINYYFIEPSINKSITPFLGVFLKTNFGMADFIGCHLGFSIDVKR